MELHKDCGLGTERKETATLPGMDKNFLMTLHSMEQVLGSLCARSKELNSKIDSVKEIVHFPANSEASEKLSVKTGLEDFHYYRVEKFTQDFARFKKDIERSTDRAYGELRDGEIITDKAIYTELLDILTLSKAESEQFVSGQKDESGLKKAAVMLTEFLQQPYSSRLYIEHFINNVMESIEGLIDAKTNQIKNDDAIDSAKVELGLVGDLDIREILAESALLQSEVKHWSQALSNVLNQNLSMDEAQVVVPLVSKAVDMFKADWRNLSFLNEAGRFATPALSGDFAHLLDLPARLLEVNQKIGMNFIKESNLLEFTMAIQEELMGDWGTIYGTDLGTKNFAEAYQEANESEKAVVRDRLKNSYPRLANVPDEKFGNDSLVLYYTKDDYFIPHEGAKEFNEAVSRHDHFFYSSGNESIVSTVSALTEVGEESLYRSEAVELLRSSKVVEVLFKRLTAHVSDDGNSISDESLVTMGSGSFYGPGQTINKIAINMPELLNEFDKEFMPAITAEEVESYGPSQTISGREWLKRNFPADGSFGSFWQRDAKNKGHNFTLLAKLHNLLKEQLGRES